MINLCKDFLIELRRIYFLKKLNIFSRKSVSSRSFPDIPDYSTQSAILVFPGDKSQKLEDIINSIQVSDDNTHNSNDVKEGLTLFPYTKVVFIDSTWNQCYGMVQDPRLSGKIF